MNLEAYRAGLPEHLRPEDLADPEMILWYGALKAGNDECPYGAYRSDFWAVTCAFLAWYEYRDPGCLERFVTNDKVKEQIAYLISQAKEFAKEQP